MGVYLRRWQIAMAFLYYSFSWLGLLGQVNNDSWPNEQNRLFRSNTGIVMIGRLATVPGSWLHLPLYRNRIDDTDGTNAIVSQVCCGHLKLSVGQNHHNDDDGQYWPELLQSPDQKEWAKHFCSVLRIWLVVQVIVSGLLKSPTMETFDSTFSTFLFTFQHHKPIQIFGLNGGFLHCKTLFFLHSIVVD